MGPDLIDRDRLNLHHFNSPDVEFTTREDGHALMSKGLFKR